MKTQIFHEAERCLKCKKPLCAGGCPVSTQIPQVINLFLEKKIEEAGKILFENNPLSLVCSYVCEHETQCGGHCVLNHKGNPVAFSEIEKYISDFYLTAFHPVASTMENGKVAVIGSGPAGITIALLLAEKNFDVTVYEGKDRIGGVLRYGIPEFRLPKVILDKLERLLRSYGVKIRPNTLIGSNLTLDDLTRDGFDAVFIGTGVWRPNKLNIKGESLGNIHYAIDYLKNPDVYKLGERVVIIGCGNTAMDVGRTLIRKGCKEVILVYNKSEDSMKTSKIEYEYTKLDGAKFLFNKETVEFKENGVMLCDTSAGEDGIAHVCRDSAALLQADSVIIAAGQGPRSVIVSSAKGIDLGARGLVAVDEDGRTSRDGVFASGDVVTGAKTVVEAVKFSKRAAKAIEEYIQRRRSTN